MNSVDWIKDSREERFTEFSWGGKVSVFGEDARLHLDYSFLYPELKGNEHNPTFHRLFGNFSIRIKDVWIGADAIFLTGNKSVWGLTISR